MIVTNSYRSGVVVAETQKSFKIRAISRTESWIPKAQCRIDHPYYDSQLAMHLFAGFAHASTDTIDTVATLSAFLPALILADRRLDAQLQLGSRVWNKVFCCEVAHAGGAWLAANPNTTVADFEAKLEECVNDILNREGA